MNPTATRQRLAELVRTATDGTVTVTDALAGRSSLAALGVDSLALLRLLDAIEGEYGVEIDLGREPTAMDSLDDVVDLLVRHGVPRG